MKNREVYLRDPTTFTLVNNGVSKVGEVGNDEKKIMTLRFELESFVCEGEYAKGLDRILSAYLRNLSKPEQQAVWVSGFFGSGKSHFVKMLRYLWEDYSFNDGASARSLLRLPSEISDQLKELNTNSKKYGGLKAVSGSMNEGSPENVNLAFLQILFRAQGLPEKYSAAKFVLWLKKEKKYDKIIKLLTEKGLDPEYEMRNLYVSVQLAKAMLAIYPEYGSEKDVLNYIKTQFPTSDSPTIQDIVDIVRQIFTTDKGLPCTLIVIDEVQQYIGDKITRAMEIQEIAEKICKDLDSRVLLVGTGQSALTSTPILQKLQARFTIPVSLSDTDVEKVTRNTVLAKKPEKVADIIKVIDSNHGEVSRHLQNTRIAPNSDDEADYALDYPLLPVRRRFWEKVLRNVDVSGATSQLRTQLKIVFDAARENADLDIGVVVPADFIYEQLSHDLLNSGILQREYHETIVGLKDGSHEGELKSRICAILFLISQLTRAHGADDGIRATSETIADLLLEDLKKDGARLRQEIPKMLDELAEQGKIMPVNNEFVLQTTEGANWNHNFNQRRTQILADDSIIGIKREELIRAALNEQLKGISCAQGVSRQPREIEVSLSNSKPQDPSKLTIWMRHGWSEDEQTVKNDAMAAGTESPILFGMLPRIAHDDLKKFIASYLAAEQVLNTQNTPTTPEAIQAADTIKTRKNVAESGIRACMQQIMDSTKIYLGGGNEVSGLSIQEKIKNGAKDALQRLYPKFLDADDVNWSSVFTKAKSGDFGALKSIGYSGEPLNHPVCKQIYAYVNPKKSGKDVREYYMSSPFGWPKDAIDASLTLITLSGNLRASLNEQPLRPVDLNQGQMGKCVFTVDIPPLTATQKLDLKALFKKVNVDAVSGQESSAATTFLITMSELAKAAGGEAPLPEMPDISFIKEVQGLSGNAQLLEIFNKRNEYEAKIKEWGKLKEVITKRWPRWKRLEELFGYAEGIPEMEAISASISAIRSNRSLLDKADPVEPLIKNLIHSLRSSLNAYQSELESVYSKEWGKLNANQFWVRLKEEQKSILLKKHSVKNPNTIKVANEDDVLYTLNEQNLSSRRTLIEAIPQRFKQALEEAAQILEPRAAPITLPSATINNEKDLERWLNEVRDLVKKRLKDGPALI